MIVFIEYKVVWKDVSLYEVRWLVYLVRICIEVYCIATREKITKKKKMQRNGRSVPYLQKYRLKMFCNLGI